MNTDQIRKDADFAEEMGYRDHANKLRQCAFAIERLRSQLEILLAWCTTERDHLGGVDGYDYKSGEEYGIRRVEIQIAKILGSLVGDHEKPSPDVKTLHQPDATPAGAVVAEGSGATAGETAPYSTLTSQSGNAP